MPVAEIEGIRRSEKRPCRAGLPFYQQNSYLAGKLMQLLFSSIKKKRIYLSFFVGKASYVQHLSSIPSTLFLIFQFSQQDMSYDFQLHVWTKNCKVTPSIMPFGNFLFNVRVGACTFTFEFF